MKVLSESMAIDALNRIKTAYRTAVRSRFEHRAKSCADCSTPGACCLDAHFVNVHITRIEAAVIRRVLDRLPDQKREQVYGRVDSAIEKYALTEAGDTFAKTYACPLYEKGTGCLVHNEGKPLPCIHHSCYENREDLPPDEMLAEQESLVERLNRRTYAEPAKWLPLPLFIRR